MNQGAAVSVPTTSINANSAVLTSPYIVYGPSGGVAIEVVSLHRNGSNATVGDSYAYLHIHGTYTNSGTVTKNYDKSVVYLKHSNTTGYTQVNASDLNFTTNILYPSGNYGNMYTAYAEVTDYVRQHGTGMYTVADIALIEGPGGNTGYFGGWGMVVVYENSKMKWRDVTIFDGYAYVQGIPQHRYAVSSRTCCICCAIGACNGSSHLQDPRAALHHRIIEVKDVRFSYLYTSTLVLHPSAARCRGRIARRLIPVG